MRRDRITFSHSHGAVQSQLLLFLKQACVGGLKDILHRMESERRDGLENPQESKGNEGQKISAPERPLEVDIY